MKKKYLPVYLWPPNHELGIRHRLEEYKDSLASEKKELFDVFFRGKEKDDPAFNSRSKTCEI